MTPGLRGHGGALLALWLGSLGCVGCLGGTVWLPEAGDDVDAVLARTPSPAPALGSSRTFLLRAVALLHLGQLNQAADAVDRASAIAGFAQNPIAAIHMATHNLIIGET